VSTVLTAQEPSVKYLVNLQPPLVRHFDLIAQAPGGVARLRELILTLAVQGKLVPQDPSDEPASELLKKIRAEKDRLIAEGKIKRDKPLSEITDGEKPFELPNGWQWIRLGSLLPFRIGKTPPSKDPQYWDTEGYDWVSISDIEHFGEVQTTQRKITRLGASLFGYEPLPVGTLIMSFKLTIGKIAVLRTPAYHNEAIVSFHPITGLETEFLKYTLPAVSKTGASKDALMGQTLNTESLSNLVMAVPPTAEQSRIVTRVEELMQVCDALEASGQLEAQQHAQLADTLLGTLTQSETPEALADNWQRIATHFDVLLDRPEAVDALEQTILQLAVRGLLVPQDPTDEPASVLLKKIRTEKDHLIDQGKIKRDKPLPLITDEEKPFELPQGWALARFGDLAQISSGVTLGRKTPISKPLLLPYLRVANVQRWTLKLESMKEVIIDEKELDRFQICSGDLLITEGGDWDKVGRTAIWQDQLPTCLHQNHVFKARGVTAEWCPEWAELYLNSDIARSYFAASAKQTTNLASINMTELKNCVFPLPPSFEQSRIITRVNELRSLCSSLRNHLASGQAVKLSLADALI
jgi:type I restriction enzyme, S subunit